MKRGVFITFEGDDGVGKSTHIRFLRDLLDAEGCEVLLVREPGGTPIGEKIREVLLDPDNSNMSPETELLLYEAARAQIVRDVILPALDRGAVVLCDRFTDSTVAYQGAGRGLDDRFVKTANQFATGGLVPDRTILMVLSDRKQKLGRLGEREGQDRLEASEGHFFDRLNDAFAGIAEEEPGRVKVVEAGGLHSDTAASVIRSIEDLFEDFSVEDERVQTALAALDAAHTHSDAKKPHGDNA